MDWVNFIGALFAGGAGVATIFAIRSKLAGGRAPRPASDAADAADKRREELKASER